jgi:phytoene desaturase
MKKKIIIVGAGPGGLTAGMLLANRGFNVTIYEKDGQVGGRNQELRLGDYVFDTGPTFLMMKFVLDDIFRLVGRKSEDYMDFVKLDPMYRLSFKDFEIDVSSDHKKLKKEIKRVFPGYEKGVDKFLKEEGTRYRYMMPCLQKDYTHFTALARPIFLRLLAHLPLRSTYSTSTSGKRTSRLPSPSSQSTSECPRGSVPGALPSYPSWSTTSAYTTSAEGLARYPRPWPKCLKRRAAP